MEFKSSTLLLLTSVLLTACTTSSPPVNSNLSIAHLLTNINLVIDDYQEKTREHCDDSCQKEIQQLKEYINSRTKK